MLGYSYYSLVYNDASSQSKLLERFPPKYAHVNATHVTDSYGIESSEASGANFRSDVVDLEVYGYIDSDDGIEAVLVKVLDSVRDKNTKVREDRGLYHITLSYEGQYEAVDSNKLISSKRYTMIVPFKIGGVYSFEEF